MPTEFNENQLDIKKELIDIYLAFFKLNIPFELLQKVTFLSSYKQTRLKRKRDISIPSHLRCYNDNNDIIITAIKAYILLNFLKLKLRKLFIIDHCLINELCFLSGQYNESNPCQRCNSSQSEDSWTENPGMFT